MSHTDNTRPFRIQEREAKGFTGKEGWPIIGGICSHNRCGVTHRRRARRQARAHRNLQSREAQRLYGRGYTAIADEVDFDPTRHPAECRDIASELQV